MKRTAAILLFAALFAAALPAPAQSDMIIKQRARQLPGATPPPPPPNRGPAPAQPPPAAVPAQPAAPPVPLMTISPEQRQKIEKLADDLIAIRPGSTVPLAQKLSLETNLLALTQSGVKPSKTVITKLANDLATAFAGQGVTAKDQTLLVNSINVVLNSHNLSAQQSQSYVNTAQNALKSARVIEADVKTVTDDLKAVVADIQKNRPSLYK